MFMLKIKLSKVLDIPSTPEEYQKQSDLDHHERWLRTLILNGFSPIYIGDAVKVSERYAGDSKNPHEGKVGVVTDIQAGLQAAFNIDYLIYTIKSARYNVFETYFYTLDRINQPKQNQLLEKILRETNSEFEAKYK